MLAFRAGIFVLLMLIFYNNLPTTKITSLKLSIRCLLESQRKMKQKALHIITSVFDTKAVLESFLQTNFYNLALFLDMGAEVVVSACVSSPVRTSDKLTLIKGNFFKKIFVRYQAYTLPSKRWNELF